MKQPQFLVVTRVILLVTAIFTPAGALAAEQGGDASGKSQELVLVENGESLAPIIVSKAMPSEVVRSEGEYGITSSEFDAEIHHAAEELADYIEKTSGVRPDVIAGTPQPTPERAIWVGYQPVLNELFPDINFEFEHPEEILIAANSNHLVIAGRDRKAGEVGEVMGLFDHFKREIVSAPIVEHGTANAVSTFLQKHLGVRWLWPGELGDDVLERRTIKFEPFVYRYHPPVRGRMFSYNPRGMDPEIFQWWETHHRSGQRGSLWRATTHSSDEWWNRFHETHPEYFALQPDGTRQPPADPRYGKLCVSNPAVAEQWLDDTETLLRENPDLTVVSKMPTDGGGWCVCENCKAWDHPDAPAGAMTERYVKFWNVLARGLKERFPDREDLYLDQMAYSTYRTPPVETRLEDNIAIRYVGHFALANKEERQREKQHMREWAAAGPRALGYRPNIFWYDGGFWGMPAVELEKTVEDFRFLDEMDIDLIHVDSVLMHYATLGPQLYAMVQLAYDPSQDGHALVADYFERGFGPAADEVRQYFELMGDAHNELVETEGWRLSSGFRRELVGMIAEVYTPELLARAQDILDRARKDVAGDGKYAERVAFVQTGLDFVKLELEIIPLMAKARNSAGRNREAVEKAIALSAERDKVLESAPPFAFDSRLIQNQVLYGSFGMQDYLGPPSEELRDAEITDRVEAKNLAVAKRWQEAFSDDFDRNDLGDDWKVLNGEWAVENGHLVSSNAGDDNAIIVNRRFTGLHRIEFTVTPTPEGLATRSPEALADKVSDLSAFIHAGEDDIQSGYFLQFGGGYNTVNALHRQGSRLTSDNELRIVPGREYTIVAEFDGQTIRLKIDGKVLLEYKDEYPLVGADHERVGLYFYTPVKVSSVKVYTAEAREAERWDDPDME